MGLPFPRSHCFAKVELCPFVGLFGQCGVSDYNARLSMKVRQRLVRIIGRICPIRSYRSYTTEHSSLFPLQFLAL
jgi:hypothetical protein